MRALCEGCGKPQPPDWKAGDLCSSCGKPVRHDVRCYWCAKWVPAAKFCRSCGATVVEERLYGAARMLKDAGTDRFTIPKQLKEFDPDQIDNFSRIYQRHAVAVARHVDEVRFLERFLHDSTFSIALEDQLIPQLPWPEETLAQMSAPPPKAGDDLSAAKAIYGSTPFPTTQALAALVRLKLRDGDAYQAACSALHTSDPAVRAEAALQLTGWRIVHTWGRPRNMDRELAEELQRSPRKLEAAVRLGLMNRGNEDLLKEALRSPDPETAFGAALVLGDVDRLQAGLKGDDLEKSAAGSKLISLGIIKPVVEPIRKSAKEVQWELVESLARRKEAAPEASDTLLEIVEKTGDGTLRERASRVLCRDLKPGWVLRIARKAGTERSILQNLLQAPDLKPESALELGDFLIEQGQFTMNQYGLSHVAEKGIMPLSFVPTRFARADEVTKKELLRFAEAQIQKEIDEPLHRFLMKVVFGPYSHEVRAAAWWTLHRTYRNAGEYRGEGPLTLTKQQLARFFGSVADFVPLLAGVLRHRETMKEVGYYELIANLLRSADEETIAEMQAQERVTDELIDAMLQAAGADYWPNTLESIILLISQVGSHPRWQDRVLAGLRSLGKEGNYSFDKAVRRL
ncbi:MAG TPA: zinc ribbon domain-containing protein, partial [Planctomycetota bacterium]|nr:zinc ribbon domain-containing protein [Planctomycetota bacterium]